MASPVWWCAQRAAPLSRSASGSLWWISTTNSAITTPARHSMNTASVRARPVSTSVSRRLWTNRLTAVWARTSSATARVGCCPAGRRRTGRAIAHAIRPATIEMISSAATGRTATSSSQVFARTLVWETCLHDGHRRIPTGGPAHRDTADAALTARFSRPRTRRTTAYRSCSPPAVGSPRVPGERMAGPPGGRIRDRRCGRIRAARGPDGARRLAAEDLRAARPRHRARR